MGSNQLNGSLSKLSSTTKSFTRGILQDPGKMENIIGMVRTFAPLTSAQTVSKVNTYLPPVEKVSTLLGMYSFLNKAQNFRPIQALDAKNPVDKITALMKNGNIPLAKLLAQPLLANNMDKIIGALATNMVKNGGLNEMLSSMAGNNSNLNDALSSLTGGNKSGLNDILASLSSDGKGENNDISSLMETFMPMINNIMASSESVPPAHSDNEVFKEAHFNNNIEDMKNDKPDPPPSIDKKSKQENQNQRPIRIRQRRRPHTKRDS